MSGQLPPLRRMILPAIFVAALFLVVFLRQPPRADRSNEVVVTGPAFGTTFTVKVVAEDSEQVRAQIASLVHEAVDRVDLAMSTYRSDSEIEKFNRHGIEPFPVSPDLLEVVSEAQRVSRLTGGAFDITVGPLVDVWGFGPGGAMETPSDQQLLELLAITGYEQILVDTRAGTLAKTHESCRIDLSAIAKGFTVDRVATSFAAAGFRNFMVEIGGEVSARGRNGAGRVWQIGIERPDADGRAVHVAVPLSNLSLATSGDYRNFVVRDGVRLSHTIDPRIGRPISHSLASVSVIHASCMTADAIATALEVLGPEDGFDLAERLELPALFLLREADERFRERPTRVWQALVESGPDARR
jgi:thiamine biosynthesis lipoprotein